MGVAGVKTGTKPPAGRVLADAHNRPHAGWHLRGAISARFKLRDAGGTGTAWDVTIGGRPEAGANVVGSAAGVPGPLIGLVPSA
jgi:hypothetical protein